MVHRARLRQKNVVITRTSYNLNLEGVCPLERPTDKEIRHATIKSLDTLLKKCNGIVDEIAQRVTKSLKL
jgi:hypothetical protein